MDINTDLQAVTGIEKLVLYIRKQLLTTFDGEKGCYLKDLVGENIHDLNELKADVAAEIDRIEEQVITTQLEHDFHIPDEELLQSLEIIEIYRDDGKVNGRIRVHNRAGDITEEAII